MAAAGSGQRLGLCDPLAHQHSGRQRRGPDRRASSAWSTKASRASRTIGARCAHGPGAPAARSITSRPTRRWTPSRSASKATRATARRPSSPWRTTPRFAIAYVSSSGEGGAKMHRRNWGEMVENVAATSEYHWMAGNFLKYAGPLNWNDLPVDSHELVALCAPRPVFISGGATEGRRMGGRQGHVPGRGRRRAGLQTARARRIWAPPNSRPSKRR